MKFYKPHITPEEFAMIQKAIESTLNFWQYDYIESRSSTGHAMSMHKEVFFNSLKGQFVIE